VIHVYALCTGWIELDRASMLSDLAPGQPWTVPVLSFLVDHPRGRLLFDTGVHCQARVDPVGRLGPERVKRLTVKPGAKLSAQMHHHRAEHWVVVVGTAKVLRGEDTVLLSENQSIYIPIGTVHRLENPGKVPLHLIEVQSGSYLGEDDIVRFEDSYGRAPAQKSGSDPD